MKKKQNKRKELKGSGVLTNFGVPVIPKTIIFKEEMRAFLETKGIVMK